MKKQISWQLCMIISVFLTHAEKADVFVIRLLLQKKLKKFCHLGYSIQQQKLTVKHRVCSTHMMKLILKIFYMKHCFEKSNTFKTSVICTNENKY